LIFFGYYKNHFEKRVLILFPHRDNFSAELVQGAALAAGRIASANVAQIKDPRDRDRLEIEGGELIMKTFREAQKARRSPGGKRKRP
jgi:hypothetical protein